MSFGIQEGGAIDIDRLLEEIEKIDDLEALDNFLSTVLSEKQYVTEEINKNLQLNSELKDELNKTKCIIKELDQIHNDEQQKIDNLRKNIDINQQEVFKEQAQQVDDLDQFELEVSKITKKFTTAPKEYENNHMMEKIYHQNQILEENKGELQQKIEKNTIASCEFNKPVEITAMDLPLKTVEFGITEIMSFNKNLSQSLDQLSKEVDKLRFDMMTNNFTRQSGFSKN